MRVDHLFGIKHYAGDVEYDTRGIIEKNRDNLPQEGVDLLLSSEIPFTVLLGTIEANKNTPPPESPLSPKPSGSGGGGRRGGKIDRDFVCFLLADFMYIICFLLLSSASSPAYRVCIDQGVDCPRPLPPSFWPTYLVTRYWVTSFRFLVFSLIWQTT